MTESNVFTKQIRGNSNSVAITISVLADKTLSLGNSTAYILVVFQELFHMCTSVLF